MKALNVIWMAMAAMWMVASAVPGGQDVAEPESERMLLNEIFDNSLRHES